MRLSVSCLYQHASAMMGDSWAAASRCQVSCLAAEIYLDAAVICMVGKVEKHVTYDRNGGRSCVGSCAA